MLKFEDAAKNPRNADDGDRAEGARPDRKAKRRLCLRCQTPFDSQWAGERICKRCKSHAGWSYGR
jgi:hypothetical protein